MIEVSNDQVNWFRVEWYEYSENLKDFRLPLFSTKIGAFKYGRFIVV